MSWNPKLRKVVRWPEKAQRKKNCIIMFWSHACTFWSFEIHCLGWGKGVNSRLVIPLLRGGQACSLGALIQSIVNLIILHCPQGWSPWQEMLWMCMMQDLSLLLSGKAVLMVLSKQPHVHPTRNDSSMCPGPHTIPATLLGRVAQLWVTTGPVWLDQNRLQMAAVTCLYLHMASKQ